MKVGIVQLSVSDDPAANLAGTLAFIGQAFDQGADIVCTPEVTGFITTDPLRQAALVCTEDEDPTLIALCRFARDRQKWIAIGSLAIAGGGEKLANRSFMVGPDGSIHARYDKIHMFDVVVSPEEKYRESARYQAGNSAVLAQTPMAKIGMTICYDLRFPHLYRDLAQAGADVILVPSAFSPVTGQAHWETLLRARAIETGCFVIAAAQTGTHVTSPKSRSTFGHSLVVDPWGAVILDMGTTCGVAVVDLDLVEVAQARQRVPSLQHDRDYKGP